MVTDMIRLRVLTLFFLLINFYNVFSMQASDYIKHKVEKGQTIYAIGRLYEVSPVEILKLNPEAQNGIEIGQIVLVPNTGKTPVVISNVQPSCGCTTPEWTREPVMPGKTGKVTASFNSAGRPGNFNKTVTVMNNGEVSQIVLAIQGSVAAKR